MPYKDLEVEKLFASFSEALSECPKSGYQNPDLVNVVVEKNRIYREKLSVVFTAPTFDIDAIRAVLASALSLSRKKLIVIDFGGGGGNHYAVSKAALSAAVEFDWRVIETAKMTKVANSVLSNIELRFFDSLADAVKDLEVIDLVLENSSLQYCEDPLKTLFELTNVGARHIFITRTPFSNSDLSYVTTQQSNLSENGPGPLPNGFVDAQVSVPITFISINKVENVLEKNYKIRYKLNEQDGYFSVNGKIVDTQFGYFCELIDPVFKSIDR